jgi:galactitol-specific phosphotransferase system IIB component
MFTIALCCGVAVNSSNVGEDMLQEAFKERGITGVELIKCHLQDVDSWLPRADLIIPFLLFTVETDKPIISGVQMISGGRKKRAEVIDQIITHIPAEYGGTKED